MTTWNKVFFHGPGTGIGKMMRELDSRGIPFFIKSANDVGFAVEGATLARTSGTAHTIVLRFVNPGIPAGGEVPNYMMSPDLAAIQWHAKVMQNINASPELEPYKDLVWIEVMNELRTRLNPGDAQYNNMHPADWLGWFALKLSQLFNADGYKHMAFGMNCGEPEPEAWLLPGMVAYLKYCHDHRGESGVSLHEYNWDMVFPDYIYPHLLGRFEELHDACDSLGIARPLIVISEWGWAYDNIPNQITAMEHIAWYATLIAQWPNVLGAAMWRLDGWDNRLKGKVAKLIPWITEYTINTEFPDIEPPPVPDPPVDGLESAMWADSVSTQCISLNRDAGLQDTLVGDGFNPVGTEIWWTYNGREYAYMAGERLEGVIERRVYYAPVPEWNNIRYFSSLKQSDDDEPKIPPPPPPTGQIDMGRYFFPPGGNYGDKITLKNNWGAGDESAQLQRDGDISYIVKNQSYEKKLIGRGYIKSILDTSPGDGQLYMVDGPWLPRWWRVGDSFTSAETITFLKINDCSPVLGKPPYAQVSTRYFATRHFAYTSPDGITLNDVVEIFWIVDDRTEEIYWYAAGLGLVEWVARDGRHSWIVERIPVGSQENLTKEVIDCL